MLKNDWTDGWGQGRDQRVAGLQGPLREDEIHEGQRTVALAYSSVADGDRLGLGAPITLSDGERAQYPDVTAVPGGVLVAWTRGSVRDGSVLALRRVELP